VEYLEEFMLGVNEGGGLQRAQERLVAKKKLFELEKSRAVGRGRPFMRKLEEAKRLTELCNTMTRQLGLVGGNGHLALSSAGRDYLESNNDTRSRLLIQGMLRTYVRFRRLVWALTVLKGHEIEVPMTEDTTEFVRILNRSGLPDLSRIYFETVVTLATQLGLTNWHQKEEGPRSWVVYLTSSVLILADANKNGEGFAVDLGGERWRITFNSVPVEKFQDQLWKDYLRLTRYVARKPILYSDLRSRVCYSLRISDISFDNMAKQVMQADSKFLLVGAGGTLSFRRDSASLRKSLPPKTDRGEYTVYLKMDKRN
jgi:hypothetical protein